LAARRIGRRGAHRDTTAVVGHGAAVAVAAGAIIDAMAIAIVETMRTAKPPARKPNATEIYRQSRIDRRTDRCRSV